MYSNPRSVKKLVRLITDAETENISLVAHGANQQPFAFVKTEELIPIEKASANLELSEDSLKITDVKLTRPSKPSVGMQKAEFDAELFDNKTASEYLKSMGFSDFKIEKNNNKLIAKSNSYDSFQKENVSMVKANKPGVEFFIGKVSIAENSIIEKSEGQAKVELLDLDKLKMIQKFDYWSAMYSSGKTMSEVLEEAMRDGMPPGADEINTAFWTVVANAVMDREYDKITMAAKEMAQLIVDILQVFDKVTVTMEKEEMAELVEKTLIQKSDDKENKEAKKEEPSKEPIPNDDTASKEINEDTTEGHTQEEAILQASHSGTETISSKPPEASEPGHDLKAEGEANEAEKLEKSDDLLAKISALLDTKLDTVKKELKEELSGVATRVEKLEGTSTIRKGADVADSELSRAEDPKVAKEKMEKSRQELANVIGL